jgi:hypothetical protein
MPRVFQKFRGVSGVDRVVENLLGDVHQHATVATPENLNFDAHGASLSARVILK